MRFCVIPICLIAAASLSAGDLQPFVGVMGQITTFSAASSSVPTLNGLGIGRYEPENGPGIQLFAGAHLNNWFSGQANYVWRNNDVSVSSTSSSAGMYFSERRHSSQSGFIVDGLVYFRPLTSRIRPFLGFGFGFLSLTSTRKTLLTQGGAAVLPPAKFSSVRRMLDYPVGVDLLLTRRVAFRYSFSEMRRNNDFADQLIPRGSGSLLDFQNMFGIVFQP